MNTGVKLVAPLALVAAFLGGLAMMPAPEPPTLAEKTELAVGYYKVNRLPEARKILREVLAQDPENFRAHYGLGLVELQDKELAKAEKLLKKALALKPDDVEVKISLGALYQRGRAYKPAEDAFLAVLKQDPTNAKAVYNLGMLALAQRRLPEAERRLTEYLRLSPTAPDRFRVKKKIDQIQQRLKEDSKK